MRYLYLYLNIWLYILCIYICDSITFLLIPGPLRMRGHFFGRRQLLPYVRPATAASDDAHAPAHGAGDLAERQAAWGQWVTFGFVEMKHLMYRKYHIISYYHIFWCFTNLFQYGYNRPAHIAEYVFLKEQHIVESHCLYIVYIDRIIHISSRYFMISLHFCNLESPQTIRLKMVSKRAEHLTWNWK